MEFNPRSCHAEHLKNDATQHYKLRIMGKNAADYTKSNVLPYISI